MAEVSLRVLHVINSLSGSGGAEQGLVREIAHLGPGIEQVVTTLYGGGQLDSLVEDAGIETRSLSLRSDRSGWNWITGVRRLRRTIESYRPDVLHSSLASANLVSQLATRPSRIPVLSTFTLSGDVSLLKAYQPGADSWRAAAIRRVGAFAARSDHVWFRALTTDAALTNVEALGIDEGRVVVIPRGVPTDSFATGDRHDIRKELDLQTGIPIVLNVGRQTAQKGHLHLVEAFQALRRSRPAHLVILGRRGDATPELSELITSAELDEDVTVIPYTENVRDYYRAADVFAFPSLMEGLGTAVIEAMAAGLPVVAFGIPPVREVTDSGRLAILVPVGDTKKLTDALVRVLEDRKSTNQMVVEARDWASDRYSIREVATRLRAELERLVAQANRSRSS